MRPKPMRLKVDWPTLLIYGVPGLILTEIHLVWFLLPAIPDFVTWTLMQQEHVVMAAGGFLVGIAVAKAIRIEAQEPSDQAVDTGVTRLD